MGWSYRRSVKFGPFRLNFSKSGIGVSAGVRGARVSTGPRGTHLNLGTNGFYYRQKVAEHYSASSSARQSASLTPIDSKYFSSLPGRYPEFPKHGPPRIVKTLGYLTIPAAVIFLWILSSSGISTNSNNSRNVASNITTPTETAALKSITNRERGFQAGVDYGRTEITKKTKLEPRRVKKLAGQMSSVAKQDQEWELGWIEGYTKEFETARRSVNDSLTVTKQPPPQQSAQTTYQSIRPSANNRLIRGPRGGCYYISGSGRKVYVDRGMCN